METYIDKIMKDKKSTLEIKQTEIEEAPIIERILWDSIDTPTRESIINELNCWGRLLEGMESYASVKTEESRLTKQLKIKKP